MNGTETANPPVGVFLSYAREDNDILQAVNIAFEGVRQHTQQRLAIFFDTKSINAGDKFDKKIKEALASSDYLVLLYTGTYKKSHSFTGFEVGYFTSLMDRENQAGTPTSRRIVAMFTEDPPDTTTDVQGIDLSISLNDLSSSRQGYLDKVRANVNQDPLTGFFNALADRVDERLPAPVGDEQGRRQQLLRERFQAIQQIVPALRGQMYDSLSSRVARRSIEQCLITFELPKGRAGDADDTIPESATLTQHGDVFELFGIDLDRNTITWREFREGILSRPDKINAATVQAIERAFTSAISPKRTRDNEQIIRGIRDDRIYRLIVTQHFNYYDGRKVLNLYLIEALESSGYGDKRTTTLLGLINLCAKYRFIFVEPESPLSLLSFQVEKMSPKEVQEKVRQLVRELLLIEDESRVLRLDTTASIHTYGQGLGTDKILELQAEWYQERKTLMSAADVLLKEDPDSSDFSKCFEGWLAALKTFSAMSLKVNSTIATQALETLKESFQ